jgi:hypothetical protein
VTVLFADLKGSMELLADRDAEEARRLLDPVLKMEAVHHYECTGCLRTCEQCFGAALLCGYTLVALTVQAEPGLLDSL